VGSHAEGWEPWKIPVNHDRLLAPCGSEMMKLNKVRKKVSERKIRVKKESLSNPLCDQFIYFSFQSPCV
jgi:hypothetical protein